MMLYLRIQVFPALFPSSAVTPLALRFLSLSIFQGVPLPSVSSSGLLGHAGSPDGCCAHLSGITFLMAKNLYGLGWSLPTGPFPG